MTTQKKIIVQFKFTLEEAAITRARNPDAVLCDANNFSFVNFKDADISPGNDTPETKYLVAKAKGEKPAAINKPKK